MNKASDKEKRDEFGKDIAFGMQQTFACWATDFIDPYVGKVVQDRFKDKSHNVTLGQTWGGEIVGDGAALGIFLGLQRFAPGFTRKLTHVAHKVFNPLLEKAGRKHLQRWAREQRISEKSDTYKNKLEEYQEFQADNIAKSSVISVSSMVANVATQKAMGNTHKLPVIIASKLIGSAITMGTMVTLRFAIPKTTRQLDDELSEAYFSPLIHNTQKLFGVKETHRSQRRNKEAATVQR